MTADEAMNKVDLLINKNNQLLDKMKSMRDDAISYAKSGKNPDTISTDKLNEVVYDLNVILKQIEDNKATMHEILRNTVFDSAYYQKYVDNFYKRANYFSDNIALTIPSDSAIPAIIKFTNSGYFYSWTDEKNIKLSLEVVDIDLNSYSYEEFNLDTALNVPGDEELNQDMGVTKIFDITFNSPVVMPGNYIIIMQIKDSVYSFEVAYKKSIIIS